MATTVAYVSRGKLFVKEANDPAREIERSSPASPSSRSSRSSGSSPRIRVSGVARGREKGELLYALDTAGMNGVFAVDLARDPEKGADVDARIFHSDGHRVHHLHARGDHGFVACDVVQENGSARIAIMQADGSDITIVTDGNALDLAPRWIPGETRALVYQSAKDGTGPFAIRKIDVRKQALETLAADTSLDFLAPQVDADGALYVIARPYAAARSPLAALWLALIVLMRAIADAVRARFGVVPKSVEDTRITVWGTSIDVAKSAQSGDDTPAIVPATWRLCRRAAGAEAAFQTVAKGVVAFDLDDRGGLVFTNGRAIYAIDAQGTKTRLCTGDAIEQVALLA